MRTTLHFNWATNPPAVNEENSCHLSHSVPFFILLYLYLSILLSEWKSLVASWVSFRGKMVFMDVPAILMLLAVSAQLLGTTGKRWTVNNIYHWQTFSSHLNTSPLWGQSLSKNDSTALIYSSRQKSFRFMISLISKIERFRLVL